MKRKILATLLVSVFAAIIPIQTSLACTNAPPATTLRIVIITPTTITLIFDPWTTFAAPSTATCACALRVPTGVIASVDAVRLTETISGRVLAEFPWLADTDTGDAVEILRPAGAGNAWFGFSAALSGAVAAGTSVEFQVDVTLQSGQTAQDLLNAINADTADRVFTDEADSSGLPLNTHQAFVDSTTIVPTLSEWGIAVLALVLMSGLFVIARRRRRQDGAPA